MAIIKTVSLVFAIFLTLALGNTAISQEVITAEDLTRFSYKTGNDAAFNLKYTNKTLIVRGIVISSLSEGTHNYLLTLDGWSNYSVRLFFPKSNAQQIATIQVGDDITIRGTCIGRGGSQTVTTTTTQVFYDVRTTSISTHETQDVVYIYNCSLIKINKTGEEAAMEERMYWEARRQAEEAKKRAEQEAEKAKKEAEQKKEQERIKREYQESAEQRARWEKEAKEAKANQQRQQELRHKNGVVQYSYLTGREIVSFVRPNYSGGQEEGKVVFIIVIDPSGKVTKATIVKKTTVVSVIYNLDPPREFTTIKDKAIRKSALDAVKQATFAPASSSTTGIFTYHFSR
jgi:hypothetical protein